MLVPTVMVLLAAGQQEADLEAAFSADNCDADSLHLLQAKGEAETLTEDQSVSESSWQGTRETGSWCTMHSCSASLGPTDCHHFRCVCKEDYIYTPDEGGKCVAKDSETAARLTGKSCYLMGCSSSLGAVKCVHHMCLCWEGFTFQGGSCVSGQAATFEPETTTQEMPAAVTTMAAETVTETPAPPVEPAPAAIPVPPAPVAPAPVAPASEPAAEASTSAACSAAPACAKLNLAGDCCPNAAGIKLGCC
eukprot:CAMPEP_0197650066 /NCGR_PEP_ID=MMETSP1338-20131121/30726_1 /TAXON_ID=43686 ORGANISM="Pelagodinium beii, Strain RCC1491" /NCGR_SAMPLE_ID=MMETSP1338 /ASSEMBLY_ACC=CAM_ASM_000754 /LENGTH=248 /DNA_ID=CAMNT_0043224413 /DNA_START=101 /DNA_END=847 /DNA_ORIENTATION=+